MTKITVPAPDSYHIHSPTKISTKKTTGYSFTDSLFSFPVLHKEKPRKTTLIEKTISTIAIGITLSIVLIVIGTIFGKASALLQGARLSKISQLSPKIPQIAQSSDKIGTFLLSSGKTVLQILLTPLITLFKVSYSVLSLFKDVVLIIPRIIFSALFSVVEEIVVGLFKLKKVFTLIQTQLVVLYNFLSTNPQVLLLVERLKNVVNTLFEQGQQNWRALSEFLKGSFK